MSRIFMHTVTLLTYTGASVTSVLVAPDNNSAYWRLMTLPFLLGLLTIAAAIRER